MRMRLKQLDTENPHNTQGIMRLGEEPCGNGRRNHILVSNMKLANRRIGEAIRSRLEEREGYGRRWMGKVLSPQYGDLSRTRMMESFKINWLADNEIENDL